MADLASVRLALMVSRDDGPVNGRLVNSSNARTNARNTQTNSGTQNYVGVGGAAPTIPRITNNGNDGTTQSPHLVGVGDQFASASRRRREGASSF